MTRKDIFYYVLLVIFMVLGGFVGGYGGGIITGAGIAMLFAAIVGKRVAREAAARIDKRVKDILVEEDLN